MPEYLYISDNFSVSKQASKQAYIYNRYARGSGKPRRAELPMTGRLCAVGLFGVSPLQPPAHPWKGRRFTSPKTGEELR